MIKCLISEEKKASGLVHNGCHALIQATFRSNFVLLGEYAFWTEDKTFS